VASNETALEVNADKTEYMFMTRDHDAGRSHNVKINNNSFARVEESKYMGTTLTNQRSVQEETASRLMSGKACCLSKQNLLSSSLLSKNLNIKIHRNIFFLLFIMGEKLGRSH